MITQKVFFWAKNILCNKINDRNMCMLGCFIENNKAILLFMRKFKLGAVKRKCKPMHFMNKYMKFQSNIEFYLVIPDSVSYQLSFYTN